MKYEKAITSYTIYAEDISIYPQLLAPGKITYGSDGVGEAKQLPVKVRLIKTSQEQNFKERDYQVVLELCGEYHVEELTRAATDPATWHSYGKIWLSKYQARALIDRLRALVQEIDAAGAGSQGRASISSAYG
jgi:hypothetical protein